MRFTPDPAPPPVAERPLCPACRKPLKPWISPVYADSPEGFLGQRIGSTWKGGYDGYGSFCTLRCCATYANVIYRDKGLILVGAETGRGRAV